MRTKQLGFWDMKLSIWSVLSKLGKKSCSQMFDINSVSVWTMASGPITSWQIDGETGETVADFIFLDSKITADGAAMKLKDTCSFEGKL